MANPPAANQTQILKQLTTSWGGDDQGETRTWAETTISYGLPGMSPDNSATEQPGWTAMSTQQADFARLAFELWDDLIPINLTEDTTNPQSAMISLGFSTTTKNNGTYATPWEKDPVAGSSDHALTRERIWLSLGSGWPENQAANFGYGNRGLENMMHEIGHTLGLSHPGQYDAGSGVALSYGKNAEYSQDTQEWTIMSYFAPGADGASVNRTVVEGGVTKTIYATTPMLNDIDAIQSKYGADWTTRAGNDTYGFHAFQTSAYRASYDFTVNKYPVIAIWDAGGHDTIDLSGFSQNQKLSLVAGVMSDVGPLTKNFIIAHNVTIEDAVGGSGSDVIHGNGVDNHITGGDGADYLYGDGGNDLLESGQGGGQLFGESEDDHLIAGGGADYMDGGLGNDLADYSRSDGALWIELPYGGASGKVQGGYANGDTLLHIERIDGSIYSDIIRMDDAENTINGDAGADILDGRGNADFIRGEAGNDTLIGGAGADYLSGGDDFDTAVFNSAIRLDFSNRANDQGEVVGDSFYSVEQFDGSADADTMIASTTARRFAGEDGEDHLYGGSGDDWLQGGTGRDYLDGGAQSDTVSYADKTVAITALMDQTVALDNGTTTHGKVSVGGYAEDTLVNIENVEGTNLNDHMKGNDDSNTFWGLGGNDVLQGYGDSNPGEDSTDFLEGGDGDDIVVMAPFDFGDGGNGTDTAQFIGGALNLNLGPGGTSSIGSSQIDIKNFETFIGSSLADKAVGAAVGETFDFGGGNDEIHGGGGNDFIVTGAGNDIMDGGADFDTIVFSKAMVADWQSGTLDADIAGDSFQAWEAIQGSAGEDRIRTNSWGFAITLHGMAGNDVLATGVTGVVADHLYGEEGTDDLNGGAGDDYLDGGTGDDTMTGGVGNDTFYVDSAADHIVEAAGGGSDRVYVRTLTSYTLAAGLEIERLATSDTASKVGVSLTGNEIAQVLTGTAGDDTLDGAGGADTMYGRGGSDTYIVDNAGDVIDESLFGGGIDTIKSSIDFSLSDKAHVKGHIEKLILTGSASNAQGSAGAESFSGNSSANQLNGEGGNDGLSGGAGNDQLTGGTGDDVLNGGADKDKLDGGKGTDKLIGGKGVDQLLAGKDDDRDVFIFGKGDSGKTAKTADEIFQFDSKKGNEKISDKIDLRELHMKWGDIDISGKHDSKVLIDYHGSHKPDMMIEVMNVTDLHKADFLL